jgi:hypothetical protein
VIGGVTIFQNVQQQINQYALATYKVFLAGLKDTAVKTEDVASKGVDASSRVSSSVVRSIERALGVVYSIGKYSLNTFFKVMEKAVGSPESVVVGVLMYRVVDMTVNVQSQGVNDAIDNFVKGFESMALTPPEIQAPSVSFKPLYDALDGFKSMVEDSINNLITQMDNWRQQAQPGNISLGCSQPSLEQSLSTLGFAWLGYGLCLLGQAVINGLLWLGYKIVELGIAVAKFLLTVLKYFVDFIVYVNKGLLTVLEKAVNGLLWVLTGFANLIIKGLFLIANTVFEWVVKKPIVFIVKYVIKPIANAIIDGFNNMKNIMKAIICDYLKISPFALGFTTWVTRGWKRALASMLISVLFVSLLAPECAMIPLSTPPAIAYPTPPAPTVTPTVLTHVATVSIGVSVLDTSSGVWSKLYEMGFTAVIGSVEQPSVSQPSIYSGVSSVSVNASDTSAGYSSTAYSGSSTILISVSD